ncbi:MAG: chorismate--pyruvate lyase [Oscillospiraceae bacterium]|jgi:hypothetical protein|nr:chorismate--pyruvate lyase [Oscillospiraceae bacterium]
MFEIIYTVRRIDGDYAILIAEGQQDENPVARALLPEEIQEGSRLLCRDFVYTLL